MSDLRSAACIRRLEKPVLTRKDVPYPAALIFNAGVAKFGGRYVMAFRNDAGDYEAQKLTHTNMGLAFSDDGIHWKVEPEPFWSPTTPELMRATDNDLLRVYDPRLTVIDGRCYLCFACDTKHGLRGGIAVTDDLKKFEVLSLSVPDNRNMVLFPEKVSGKFVRLERPMPIYSRGKDRFDIWLSTSPDCRFWGESRLVAGVEHFPYANDKIGPAAPPVRTKKGWLTTVHCVDIDPNRGKNGWEPAWKKRYTAGLMLLDLNDPARVIALSKQPLIFPEVDYERNGFRNDVIFPGGMILEPNGEVKIYYGAADTVEALATAHVDELLALCEPV
jgi:beta-1,4-mannooligosaccharide/beta-1,4-mannosyl-N-acetylglucosamine phosphorylase